MATVQLRRKDVGENKDFESLLSKLNEKYGGQWVAILGTGEIIAADKPEDLSKLAEEKGTEIVFTYQASKENQQFFL